MPRASTISPPSRRRPTRFEPRLTGFKTYERKGVRIATQQFLTLDITLEVGQVQETITVTADAPLIETSNASTGGTLDRQVLEALPAPGRNAFMISVTVPTVAPTGDPQFNRQQDQTNASRISMGGGGVRANNYLLDGVPITELRGRAVLNPTIEALEEVKVQVHTYDAEMGRTGGGVFNVTAKSGTNEYHGSGFYQTRPVWGVSENFFVEKTGQSKEESGLSEHLLPPVRRRRWADRSGRTGRFSGPRPKAIAPTRRATSSRSGRA